MPTFIVKPSKDEPIYMGWSTVSDMPSWVAGSREHASQMRDVAEDRLARADAHGTSNYDRLGGWDDADGFIYQTDHGYRWLPRRNLSALARLLLKDGDSADPLALTEPIEDDE